MTNEKKQKIKNFLGLITKLQPKGAKHIGLLIIGEEKMAEIISLSLDTNKTYGLDLNNEESGEEIVEKLSEIIKLNYLILIRLHEYLNPKIYNQLYLLAKKGQMEFPLLEDRVFVEADEKSAIVLITTDKEMETLNYKNIFDIVSYTQRLDD